MNRRAPRSPVFVARLRACRWNSGVRSTSRIRATASRLDAIRPRMEACSIASRISLFFTTHFAKLGRAYSAGCFQGRVGSGSAAPYPALNFFGDSNQSAIPALGHNPLHILFHQLLIQIPTKDSGDQHSEIRIQHPEALFRERAGQNHPKFLDDVPDERDVPASGTAAQKFF